MNKLLILFALIAISLALRPEEIFLNEDQYPGYIEISAKDKLFYWLFKSRSQAKATDPLVIWLTGGPGCSSEMALFVENGPFTINEDLNLTVNPYSWNNNSHLLYVDQPIGTGYSTGPVIDYATNEQRIASDFYKFFVGFLEKFPEFKGRALFITGESYAGHYIPAISAYLHQQNNTDVNLVGSAIGNGWVDPYYQYPAYSKFAYENKLIGSIQYHLLNGAFAACQGLIKSGLWPVAMEACQLAVTTILGFPLAPRFNVYDVRKKCEHPPLCYDFTQVTSFLKRDDVIDALGVSGIKWVDCNMAVHTALLGDWVTDLAPKVAYLLENGVRVLVYSGDKDFICNWRGGESWTNQLKWEHQAEFQNSTYVKWNVAGKSFGEYREADNLTFLRVYDAGHMVPMDQPEAALAMLNEFLQKWAQLKGNKATVATATE